MLCVVLALLLTACPPHEGKHEQIDAATVAIEKAPQDLGRRLARAEIYLLHAELDACAGDLEVARRLAPKEAMITWLSARLEYSRKRFTPALELVDSFLTGSLEVEQRHRALLLRAQCLTELAQTDLAIEAWSLLLKEDPNVQPGWYLKRATLLTTKPKGLELSIASLEQGLERLGPVVNLLLRAAELEEQLGRTDAAVARIEELAELSTRKETWLKKQGDILLRAERFDDAQARYAQALLAWQQLSEKRRQTTSMKKLLSEIQTGLAEVQNA